MIIIFIRNPFITTLMACFEPCFRRVIYCNLDISSVRKNLSEINGGGKFPNYKKCQVTDIDRHDHIKK